MLFQPSPEQVRRFFIEAWQKAQQQQAVTALEALAVDWIVEHPEYQAELNTAALQRDYSVEHGATNPFLHLALHLSLSEQTSIDQPPGIRAVVEKLAARDSLHQAHHHAMECLAQTLWHSQRNGTELDSDTYLEQLRQLI